MSTGNIVLLILGILLFLIILLLVYPVKVFIYYENEELKVKIGVLFVKKKVFPTSKKPKKKSSEKAQEKLKKTSKKPFKEQVKDILDMLPAASKIVKAVLEILSLKFTLDVKTGGEDAAEIATECGKDYAYFHSAAAIIANFMNLKKREINISPDYDSKKTQYRLKAAISVIPISLILLAVKLLPELMKVTKNVK